MASDKKPNRPKARLPRGFDDRGPAEIAATRRMIEKIREVYERYGFDPVETPAIEYTDALGKFLPDQDRPNEGVFSFQDDDEQWLSLRYDLTAPLARYVAENFDALPKPYRSYRFGWVFRNEKPGPGRFRQFMQFDADTVGSNSPAADAEICMMAADTLEALGIPRGQYVVRLSDRRIWDGVLEIIGLASDRHVARKMSVLRAIDKLDRLGLEGVEQLLGSGRKDESGDFTPGAGLNSDQVLAIMSLLHGSELDEMVYSKQAYFVGGGEELLSRMTFSQDSAFMNNLRALSQKFSINESFSTGIDSLEQIEQIVRTSGCGPDRIRVAGTVVRGLEYYTGPVFEAELTFEIKDEKGRPVRFGSVGGGGRYDGLVARFKGQDVPATGFSIGVSRLQAALTHLGKLDAKPDPGPVVVTVFDRDRVADYQRMVSRLRNAGIRAELYLGNPKNFGNQLKYADKRNAPCVVIQGGDEKAKGEVQIKDLALGAEIAGLATDREEYREKQAQAQIAVPEEKLVEAVRDLLARHGIGSTK
jgi:histidyl-tRNA synthetase